PRQVEALLHSSRVDLDLVPLAAGQAQALDQLGDAPPRDVGWDPVEVGEVAKVVEAGKPPVQSAIATENEADPAPNRVGLPYDVQTENARRPRVGKQKGGKDLDRCRFAGPVRTEQAVQLTRWDGKVDPVEPDCLDFGPPEGAAMARIRLPQACDLDRRLGWPGHEGPYLISSQPRRRWWSSARGAGRPRELELMTQLVLKLRRIDGRRQVSRHEALQRRRHQALNFRASLFGTGYKDSFERA